MGADRDAIERAREMWRAAKPSPSTPVETYLRGARRIPPPYPPTIRFLPRAWHSESKRRHPVMLAAVQAPDGRLRAIHRTFLSVDGRAKAPVEPVKKMLGRCVGGAVRLARVTERLAIAEGIETSLSVMHATKVPTWASLSTSGMRSLIVPPLPLAEEILIFADGDRPGLEAAEAAASRFHREGRRVRIAEAPSGRDFKDLLRGAA